MGECSRMPGLGWTNILVQGKEVGRACWWFSSGWECRCRLGACSSQQILNSFRRPQQQFCCAANIESSELRNSSRIAVFTRIESMLCDGVLLDAPFIHRGGRLRRPQLLIQWWPIAVETQLDGSRRGLHGSWGNGPRWEGREDRGGIVRRLPSTVGGEEEQCVGGMGVGWGATRRRLGSEWTVCLTGTVIAASINHNPLCLVPNFKIWNLGILQFWSIK